MGCVTNHTIWVVVVTQFSIVVSLRWYWHLWCPIESNVSLLVSQLWYVLWANSLMWCESAVSYFKSQWSPVLWVWCLTCNESVLSCVVNQLFHALLVSCLTWIEPVASHAMSLLPLMLWVCCLTCCESVLTWLWISCLMWVSWLLISSLPVIFPCSFVSFRLAGQNSEDLSLYGLFFCVRCRSLFESGVHSLRYNYDYSFCKYWKLKEIHKILKFNFQSWKMYRRRYK